MKIQAKLYSQTNFPFVMEIHDFCLSPNSKKPLNQLKKKSSSLESIHKLSFPYTYSHKYYQQQVSDNGII